MSIRIYLPIYLEPTKQDCTQHAHRRRRGLKWWETKDELLFLFLIDTFTFFIFNQLLFSCSLSLKQSAKHFELLVSLHSFTFLPCMRTIPSFSSCLVMCALYCILSRALCVRSLPFFLLVVSFILFYFFLLLLMVSFSYAGLMFESSWLPIILSS